MSSSRRDNDATSAPPPKKAKPDDDNDNATLVSLAELLSSCMDANLRGCQVIRKYRQEHTTVSGTLKEDGEIKSVVTQADIDAQHVIVDGLRHLWSEKLHIVGEEDGEDENDKVARDDKGTLLAPLRTDLLSSSSSSDINIQLPLSDVTLFVDPLDGTREFVEGRLQNVGCLIGIARRGKAIAGVVGVPFPAGNAHQGDALCHYAIQMDNDLGDVNLYGVHPSQSKDQNDDNSKKDNDDNGPQTITIFTGDSKDPVLANATQHALRLAAQPKLSLLSNSDEGDDDPPNHVILGGTASKFVAVAQTPASMAVLHFKTCYWDTCATEAVLKAKGGKVTDLFGTPLMHKDDQTYDYGNLWGVVASAAGLEDLHDALCKEMRQDRDSLQRSFQRCMGDLSDSTLSSSAAQAVDISRDLNGLPLTKAWIEGHVLAPTQKDSWTLKGYAVPEAFAVRGLMSNGARLVLNWEESTKHDEQENNSSPPSSVFYKRIVMSDLAHARAKLVTAPHKVVRDVHSYQVETNFLTSQACQQGLIQKAGVRVCRCYGSELQPAQDGSGPRQQLESKFCMLLEDFAEEDGWQHEWLLEETSAKAALRTFANLHAYFWTGSTFWKEQDGKWGEELERAVWLNGGYMQPSLQGYDQLEKVASGWTNRLPSFEGELRKLKELENVNLEEIGVRVEKVAKYVGTRAHPFAEKAKKDTIDLQQYRTLCHGDPKQANIFLRNSTDMEEPEVGLIDFQWCGFGLAATDIAHFMSAALQPQCLSYDGSKEKELLDFYYASLSVKLVEYGVAASEQDVHENVFPRRVLQDQYEIALLDISRMVFAYAWARWKPESKPTASSLARNAYNKSLASVLWFVTRCSQLLAAREDQLSTTGEKLRASSS